MLADIARQLRCPVCQSPFLTAELAATGLRCDAGHHFDLARQGYLNLLTGRAPAGADTPQMVAARAALLAEGHFDPLGKALADTAAAHTAATYAAATQTAAAYAAAGRTADPVAAGAGLVLDVGAGTGFYLAAVLDALPRHHGLALDVAKAAARWAARAHPRAGAAVCDIWRGLPLADESADVVLDVFAPRNPAEFRRVLRPDGVLLVVTPRPDHLAELVRPLGLISVDPDKQARLDRAFGDLFRLQDETGYALPLSLSRPSAARVVAMGPSAWHTDPVRLAQRLDDLPEPVSVTASVTVRIYQPR